MRDEIQSIVTSVVGPGRARVNVTAQFDFNRITQTSDRYDPDGRVLRSSQTREESSGTADNQGQVTVGNELPGANANNNPPQQQRDQSKKSEEIANYEISRTTKTEVIEGGRLNKVAIAVLVDGIYTKNDKGEQVYQDRPKEQLDRIAALVRSSVGYDAKRGDTVEVVNLRFAEVPAEVINEPTGIMSLVQFTKDDIMRGIELLVMAILGIVVLLLVVRPLVRRVITPDEAALKAADLEAQAQALQIAAAEAAQQAEAEQPLALPNNKTAKMIDIAQVKGQVHAQSIQKVGELADGNPNEAISIVRSWLNDAAA
jgi:flagellar M-ring protein FliF